MPAERYRASLYCAHGIVQRLFPTLGTLLDLRMLQVPQEEVIRLTLHEGGESWSLERQALSSGHVRGDS